MKKQSGFTLVEGLLIILTVFVVGFAGYYAWNQQQEDEVNTTDSVQQTDQENVKNDTDKPATTLSTISNDALGCSFSYPIAWGEATAKNDESAVQGMYTSYSFSDVSYEFNLYCGSAEEFEYKDFSGSITKVAEEEFVNDNFGEITKLEKYTDTTSGINWYKTGRGDAGFYEYAYLTLQDDKVIGIAFSDNDLGNTVINFISI